MPNELVTSRPPGQLTRFLRTVHPGRNPLARRWDRLEAQLLLLLIAAAVLAVPLAAVLGSASFTDQMSISTAQKSTRHQATATVLANSPAQTTNSADGNPLADTATVPARWTLPDATTRTGDIILPSGGKAGTLVRIWLGPDGSQTMAPLTRADALATGIETAVFGLLCVSAVLIALYRAGRLMLNRRRATQWEDEWAKLLERGTAH